MLPVPRSDVVIAPMEDGAVLFSSRDEVYYGLNAVGLRVWELLPPATATLDELCTALKADYADVELDVLRGDVAELLADLARLSLVTAGDAGALPHPPQAV